MVVLDLEGAKSFLNITEDGKNDELQSTIDAALAAIESLTGPIEVTDELTIKVAANSATSIVLPVLPVAELVSVTPYGGSALDLSGFYLDKNAGLVNWALGSTQRFGGIGYTLVYKAGRDPVPADLALAVKELVRHFWTSQRGSGNARPRPGNESLANSIPGAAYAFPFRVEQLLTPYIFPGFA